MHGRRWKSKLFYIGIILANLASCCYFLCLFLSPGNDSTETQSESEFIDAENKVRFRPSIGELVTFNYTPTLAKGTCMWEVWQVRAA